MAKNAFGEEEDPMAAELYGNPTTQPVDKVAKDDEGGYDYSKFMQAWLGGSGGSADDFLKANPGSTKGVTTSHGGEYFDLPGGESMDVYADFGPGGQNRRQFGNSNYDYQTGSKLTPEQAAAQEATWQSQNGVTTGGIKTPPSTAIPATPSGSTDIQAAIARLLSRGEQPVTKGSVAGQFDPVSASFQRGGQRAKQAAAERAAYQGQNAGGAGGSLSGDDASIDEDVSNSEGLAMSKFMTDELSARRSDVVNALNFAQGEEKIALQKQLADIDANLRQQALGLQSTSINNQNSQFYDNYAAGLSNQNNQSDDALMQELFG